MNGYMGKILRLDLTNKKIKTISTSDYEEFLGGHGIGSAIFFDAVKDKTISPFDPKNVITLMTSPLSGTLAPSAGGRTEVQGLGPQPYPTEWFTRSNFGGRFSAMLKYAGYDGLVIEGKADEPTWINIVNNDVVFEDADGLWGMDTYSTQEEIWKEVSGNTSNSPEDEEWYQKGRGRDKGRTTQKPAVVAIGPSGESKSRIGALIHEAGNAAGQGGFGGVFGSKNLKAISVLGTKSIEVANPKDLMKAREWIHENYEFDEEDPECEHPLDYGSFPGWSFITDAPGSGMGFWPKVEPARPQGCLSCPKNCRMRTKSGYGSESICVEVVMYGGQSPKERYKSANLAQRLGINVYPISTTGHKYLYDLYKQDFLGEDGEIETDLPFEEYGKMEFIRNLLGKIANREGIGDDLSEGIVRAAEKWGRLEQDLSSGLLQRPNWGYPQHYDPRIEVNWPYGSILGSRDINEHGFNWDVHWIPQISTMLGLDPVFDAEEVANKIANAATPFDGEPQMFDFSEENIYSKNMVKTIAWQRYYSRSWKQSVQYCDWFFPNFHNPSNSPSNQGFTPEAEPKFFNAVTGKNISFEDGMNIGKKIWNLDRSIWALQGRHRDMEKFADYVYNVPKSVPYYISSKKDGEWKWENGQGRTLDRDKFESWKTKYYDFEGWNTETGRPTRNNLEDLDLGFVADELEKKDKI